MSIRTGPRSNKVAWSDESCSLFHCVDGRVRVRRLPGEHMAPRCTIVGRQANGGSVMLWAIFFNLGSCHPCGCYFNRTTYLNIVANPVHPFMETVFPDGCGLFQQDNGVITAVNISSNTDTSKVNIFTKHGISQSYYTLVT